MFDGSPSWKIELWIKLVLPFRLRLWPLQFGPIITSGRLRRKEEMNRPFLANMPTADCNPLPKLGTTHRLPLIANERLIAAVDILASGRVLNLVSFYR
jgi:hypothetical protein